MVSSDASPPPADVQRPTPPLTEEELAEIKHRHASATTVGGMANCCSDVPRIIAEISRLRVDLDYYRPIAQDFLFRASELGQRLLAKEKVMEDTTGAMFMVERANFHCIDIIGMRTPLFECNHCTAVVTDPGRHLARAGCGAGQSAP